MPKPASARPAPKPGKAPKKSPGTKKKKPGKNVYLLLGPEIGEKKTFIRSLKKQSDPEQTEYHRFYPSETPISDIIEELRSGSLFGSKKFIIVEQCEEITQKQDLTLLRRYLDHPDPETRLIFVSTASGVSKTLENAVLPENKKIFWELFDRNKKSRITAYFQKHDVRITVAAAELLLEMVENNTEDLKQACRELLIQSKNNPIEKEDVEESLYHSRRESIFTLFEQILLHHRDGTLEIFRTLITHKSLTPPAFYGGLLWQFQKLLKLRLLINRHIPFEAACLKAQIRGKQNQRNYKSGLRRYGLSRIRALISLLARYDAESRRLKGPLQVIHMERFLCDCLAPEEEDSPSLPPILTV